MEVSGVINFVAKRAVLADVGFVDLLCVSRSEGLINMTSNE